MTFNRRLFAALGLFALAAGAVAAIPGKAEARPIIPWCARDDAYGGALDCSYYTFYQCLETMRGVGGFCVQNPWIRGWAPPEGYAYERPKRRKHVRRPAY